jgi:predicted aspartyl protease
MTSSPQNRPNLMALFTIDEEAQTDNDMIRWQARIENHEVEVILDRGADTSILSLRMAKAMKLQILETTHYIETSSGESKKCTGKTNKLEVEMEGTHAYIDFQITALKSIDCILGKNWFQQTGVLLDPKNSTFIIPTRKVDTRHPKKKTQETTQMDS